VEPEYGDIVDPAQPLVLNTRIGRLLVGYGAQRTRASPRIWDEIPRRIGRYAPARATFPGTPTTLIIGRTS
jgi:hypothetical protein